jgi:Tol biopolymer transport system component
MPRARAEWRRRALVAALAGASLLAGLAPGSATSSGAGFNAGIVWAEFAGVFGADVDGTDVRRLAPSIADELADPAWSPSGDRLVFSARNSDSVELHMLRPASGTSRVLRLRGRWRFPRQGRSFSYVLESSWAPDEQHLVVTDARNPLFSTIRVVSLRAARMLRPVTRPRDRADTLPAWSPDGRTIAFARQRLKPTNNVYRPPAIYLIGRNGRGLRRLARGTSPSWSPDGQHLVYAKGNAIYRIGADGDGRTRIAGGLAGRGDVLQPRWSPDGRKILFVTAGGGIWLMDVDGSDRVRVLRRPEVNGAGWQPG